MICCLCEREMRAGTKPRHVFACKDNYRFWGEAHTTCSKAYPTRFGICWEDSQAAGYSQEQARWRVWVLHRPYPSYGTPDLHARLLALGDTDEEREKQVHWWQGQNPVYFTAERLAAIRQGYAEWVARYEREVLAADALGA